MSWCARKHLIGDNGGHVVVVAAAATVIVIVVVMVVLVLTVMVVFVGVGHGGSDSVNDFSLLIFFIFLRPDDIEAKYL